MPLKPIVENDRYLLRNQIYEYLREQMRLGVLQPGAFINMNELIEDLGVSRTPLREALLLLQANNFVTIFPQRGVKINDLTVQEVKYIFEILGGLESCLLISVFDKIGKKKLDEMKKINEEMLLALTDEKFNYYERNLCFHDVFIELSDNRELVNLIKTLKQRLYDFRKKDFGDKWKIINHKEHLDFIRLLEEKLVKESAEYLRDVHWCLKHPESFK
ncbi:MAG: GntR family transcriptional regulator [Deltaproteobacteria bacterium]|nr:GntR family transcriptional regulator [Deltaproteobacteria bacterium]